MVALRWLRDGVRRGHSFSCGNCGLHLSGSFVGYASGAHPAWQAPLRLPVALTRVVRHRRAVRFPPYAYLSAGLVGAAAGIVLPRRLRWWSWVPAAVLPASLAGASVATAFTRRRSDRTLQALREAMESTLHPGRETQRFYRQEETIFRSWPLPLYGLGPSFRGARTLRGWEGGEDGISGLGLGHGDPFDAGSPGVEVRVNARSESRPAVPGDRLRLARELWHRAHPIPPGSPESYLARHWEREHELNARPGPAWRSVVISVEGSPVEFHLLTEAEHWVAFRELDEVFVTLWGHRMPPEGVELVRVRNLEPYVTGSRARRAQREATMGEPAV